MTRAKIWSPSHEESKRHRFDLDQVMVATIEYPYPAGTVITGVEFTDGSTWGRYEDTWIATSAQTREPAATIQDLASQFSFCK